VAYGDSYDPPPSRWAGQRPSGARGSYVRGATVTCCEQGCQAPELALLARRMSDQARTLLETLEKKEKQMMQPTQALWCEQGGHSFSEKDPNVQVLTIAGRGPDGKTEESESRTICGACAEKTKTRIGSTQNAPVSELPASGS
jgi:hypothetical protein